MMQRRRQAIDQFARLPSEFASTGVFDDIEVPAADALLAGELAPVVTAVCNRLTRSSPSRPGAALVTGFGAAGGDAVTAQRVAHRRLFTQVWDAFRRRGTLTEDYEIKTKLLSDGCIPEADYGSRWTFKPLHSDRSADLFSHLYGPSTGFSGGEVLLVDIRAFLLTHGLDFDTAFEWSEEKGESKPVLRDCFTQEAITRWGRNLGQLTPDCVLFVNNQPDSGVLHGATPVHVLDEQAFVRQYHRCSVSEYPAQVVSC
jgi:hypothetical protein